MANWGPRLRHWLVVGSPALAAGLLLVYFGYQLSAGWLKADHYLFGKRDSAIYQSALWQAGQGVNPETYAMPGLQTYTLVGLHFMPAGFLYGGLYRVFPAVHTTVVLYALSFLAAGFCVYQLGVTVTRSAAWACLLLAVYLTCYTPAVDHFYFEDWATPFVAAALWQAARRNYRASAGAWLAAAMFKEYIALMPVALGLFALGWAGWSARRSAAAPPLLPGRWAAGWVVVGSLWFAVAYFGIMRFFAPTPINVPSIGNPYTDLPRVALQAPQALLATVASPESGQYLLWLLAPWAFLPLLGGAGSVGALPILVINILGGTRTLVPNGHYTTFMLPVLVAGAALGLEQVRAWRGPGRWAGGWKILLVGGLLAASLGGLRYHVYKWREAVVASQVARTHTLAVQALLARIPPQARVAADEPLMTFLAQRRVISHLANIPVTEPDWIVRDSFYEAYPALLQQGFDLGGALAHTPATAFGLPPPPVAEFPGYHLVAQQGSVALWAKDP